MESGYCSHQWKEVESPSLPFSKKDCKYVICTKCLLIVEDRRRKAESIDFEERRGDGPMNGEE
ncbi:hypothetical protein ACFL4G_12330 [Thermodesulfobacteriota bacterium]